MLQYVENQYDPEVLFMVDEGSGFSLKLTSVFNKLANITDNDKVCNVVFLWNSKDNIWIWDWHRDRKQMVCMILCGNYNTTPEYEQGLSPVVLVPCVVPVSDAASQRLHNFIKLEIIVGGE